MNEEQIKRGQRSIFFACIYVGSLFVAVIIMWSLMLVGGNPMTVKSTAVVDAFGAPRGEFQAGDFAAVHRVICSTEPLGALSSPGLRNGVGILYPLPLALINVRVGCNPYNYGFLVPHLPPGKYVFASVVEFQSSLIGRDEHALFDRVEIEVLP